MSAIKVGKIIQKKFKEGDMITRTVYTRIWEDEFFCALSFKEKVVFLYLITNVNIGLTGAYECDDRHVMFDTGITQEELNQIKKKFDSKFVFIGTWVIIKNFNRYNNFCNNKSPKIRQGYMNDYNRLPKEVRTHLEDTCMIHVSDASDTINKHTINNNKDKKDNKEKKNKTRAVEINDTFPPDVKRVMEHYAKVYNLQYIQKQFDNSLSAERLIANYGLDKVLAMIEKAKANKGKRYYPSIGNLTDLLEKWEKLDYQLARNEPVRKEEDLRVKTSIGKEVK